MPPLPQTHVHGSTTTLWGLLGSAMTPWGPFGSVTQNMQSHSSTKRQDRGPVGLGDSEHAYIQLTLALKAVTRHAPGFLAT